MVLVENIYVKCITYLLLVCEIIINIYLISYWKHKTKSLIKKNVSKETLSYSKSIYNLELGRVLEQLSSDNRKDFEKIIKKLWTFDIDKIKEHYENSNEEESIKTFIDFKRKDLQQQIIQEWKK